MKVSQRACHTRKTCQMKTSGIMVGDRGVSVLLFAILADKTPSYQSRNIPCRELAPLDRFPM